MVQHDNHTGWFSVLDEAAILPASIIIIIRFVMATMNTRFAIHRIHFFFASIEGKIPGGLLVTNTAGVYPIIFFESVVLPVVFVHAPKLGFGSVQTVQAQTIKIITHHLCDHGDGTFEIYFAVSARTRLRFVRELFKVIEDIVHGCLHKDCLQGPDTDFIEMLLVVETCLFPARTGGVEEVLAWFPQTAMKHCA